MVCTQHRPDKRYLIRSMVHGLYFKFFPRLASDRRARLSAFITGIVASPCIRSGDSVIYAHWPFDCFGNKHDATQAHAGDTACHTARTRELRRHCEKPRPVNVVFSYSGRSRSNFGEYWRLAHCRVCAAVLCLVTYLPVRVV